MLNNIGHDPAIITCDEGIYSLSKEAQWQVAPQLDSVILRLGGFHRVKNFVGIIGRRMADSGFDEILEESGLYNQNQINGILSGKHYTRSIVAHKQFSEAVCRLYWDSFKCWIENESCKSSPLKKILSDIEKSTKRFAQLWNQEVPNREELQVSLQVNVGPNYTKPKIVIGERLQTNCTKCYFFLWSL